MSASESDINSDLDSEVISDLDSEVISDLDSEVQMDSSQAESDMNSYPVSEESINRSNDDYIDSTSEDESNHLCAFEDDSDAFESEVYDMDENIIVANLPIDFRETSGDGNRFLAEFELKYGSRHPLFYSGTYSQALDEAKRDLKFLLVYLHSETHEDTQDFCQTIVTNQQFIDFINQRNLLFWSSSVTYSDGYRVSQQLRESTYPYLALIGLKGNRMLVVRKLEGKTNIETLLTQLRQSIEENESGLIAARLEREERNMNQLIRKQQDEAFAESLKADQEKERKKMEERNKKEAEEKAKRAEEMEANHRKQLLMQLREQLVKEIPSEPTDKSNANAIHFLIKLPNGTRLERWFLKTESIRFLYYFVFCHKESPINFVIRTNFPTRDLPSHSPQVQDFVFNEDNSVSPVGTSSDAPTFGECGLGIREMLFVHDLEA